MSTEPKPESPAELAAEAKRCAELYAQAVAGNQSTGLVPHQTLINRGAALYAAIDRLAALATIQARPVEAVAEVNNIGMLKVTPHGTRVLKAGDKLYLPAAPTSAPSENNHG